MNLEIDTEKQTLVRQEGTKTETLDLYSVKAFEALSALWLKVGWNMKHAYTFTWLGRPVIQLPEDMLRVQEVIYRVRPDIIVETGVAHGGSLIFYASLCEVLGKGRVVGVDIEIRPQNREAILAHKLASRISLIEGDSTSPEVLRQVQRHISPGQSVLILLDSCHEKAHVTAELGAYAGLVTPGSYIVATDGIMKDLSDVPRGNPQWTWDNPEAAAREFAQAHPEFVLEQPAWMFCESGLKENITYWPGAWLRRL